MSFLTWKKWVKRQLADFEVTSGKNDLNVIAVDILVLIVWGQILILFCERRADPLGTAAIYTPTRRLHAFSRPRTTDVRLISKRPRIDAPFDVATENCEIRKKSLIKDWNFSTAKNSNKYQGKCSKLCKKATTLHCFTLALNSTNEIGAFPTVALLSLKTSSLENVTSFIKITGKFQKNIKIRFRLS